jgi:hypothetical protein
MPNVSSLIVIFAINKTYSIFRFAINFMDGNEEDIHFHFKVLPRDARVVRNTYRGTWMREERGCPPDFPFYPYQYFDACFVCLKDKFVVSTTTSVLPHTYV